MRLPSGSIRRIFLYAIGAGFALGLLCYGVFDVAERVLALTPPLSLLVALALGAALGGCLFLAGRIALRLVAYDLRYVAAELTGQPVHLFMPGRGDDEFVAVRKIFSRALSLLPDSRLHSALAQAIATSSADVSHRFGAAVSRFAQDVPLYGAALCGYNAEQATFAPLTTWGLPLMAHEQRLAADEGPLRRLVREGQDLVLSGAESRLVLLMLGLEQVAPLPILCMPLHVADELIGMLLLIGDSEDVIWSTQRRELARSLGSQLAVAFSEEQVRHQLHNDERDLQALIDLAHALTTDLQLDRALEHMLRTVAQLTDSEHGTLLLLDANEEVRYRIALTQGTLVPLQLVARTVLRSGLAGWALRERRPDMVVDAERDTRWLAVPGLGEMRSALVVPLLYGERALGILTLAHHQPRHYSQRMLQLASALAAQAVHIIAHAQLLGEVEREQQLDIDQRQIYQSLLPYVPQLVLDELAQEGRMPELAAARTAHAVVVAVGLRNIAAASEQLAPDTLLRELLQPFMHAVITTVREQYGYLDHCDGEGALALFGYPQQTEDAAERALLVAQRLAVLLGELRVRWRTLLRCDVAFAIGIAAGGVVTGRGSDDPLQGRYLTLGPAVNHARRLQALARNGEVLCNAALAALVQRQDDANGGPLLEALHPITTDDGDEQPYRFTRTTQGSV